jgi:hypothetical protein
MAVFLETDGSAQTVFDCARQLIERIRKEAKAESWPLGLGVGIRRGVAVWDRSAR